MLSTFMRSSITESRSGLSVLVLISLKKNSVVPQKHSGRNIVIENNLFIANESYALNVSGCDNVFMGSNVYKGKPANRKWVNARYTDNLVTDCPKN